MGILDSIFGGANGLSNRLHELLGGTATIKPSVYERDLRTGIISEEFASYEVPFVPTSRNASKASATAPSASRSDVREPLNVLTGTVPRAALKAPLRAERDRIVYLGKEYLIVGVDTLDVGDTEVQCAITARRA